jgi:alkylation response protein AidB-like acyl-CoA dehydrogenase
MTANSCLATASPADRLDRRNVLEKVDAFLGAHPIESTPDAQLRGARFDAGLAFVQFDTGSGGLGADASLNREVEQRFLDAGAADWSDRNVIGLGMAAPTLHRHGTGEQRSLLRPLFVGTHIWCQLFSEPGAGSDLAGLATRAELDGDEWVLNGQKVWSTLAHVARWGLLVARFDATLPKHRGLIYFVLDMHLPGVEVRPLRQMTGEAEFNEVYLTDVRIPASHMIGGAGDGWRVAMTTLMNERSSLGGSSAHAARPVDRAVAAYCAAVTTGRAAAGDRDRLMQCVVQSRVVDMLNNRLAAATPGPEGSLAKLAMARTNQRAFDLAVGFSGAAGTLIDNYEETRPDVASVHGSADISKAFLRTRANSIEGGTSEVLLGVAAERLLGLPGEPRADKDRPWNEVPRS